MHRATLPKNPTEDQINVALFAGFIDVDEAKELIKQAKADTEAKADAVAKAPAESKDEK
jgi:hypothetical protein